MSTTGLAVGANKGHVVTKLQRTKAPRTTTKRMKVVRDVVKRAMGLAPYEKRILEVIKTGGGNVEKRAYKMAKQRLGTNKRAKAKREELKNVYAAQRAAAAKASSA